MLFGCAVMKSMNSRQDYWQGDRAGAELKIRTLQEELERMTLEKSRVLERSVVSESCKKELGQERWGRRGWGGTRRETTDLPKVFAGETEEREARNLVPSRWIEARKLRTGERGGDRRVRWGQILYLSHIKIKVLNHWGKIFWVPVFRPVQSSRSRVFPLFSDHIKLLFFFYFGGLKGTIEADFIE